MFKPLGLLSSLQCPTQSGSDGSECSSMRAHCPFSHKDSITSTSTSATCTSNSIKIKDSNGNVNHKQSDSILLPHSPPADPIQPILKKARNAYQPNQQNQQQQGAASSSSSSSSANKSSDGFTLVGAHKGNRVENGEQSGSNYLSPTNKPIPPQLTFANHSTSSSITLSSRQASLKSFHSTFSTIYQSLLSSSNPKPLRNLGAKFIHDHSLEQELEVFKSANKHSYKNACVTVLVGLKKRDLEKIKEVGLEAAQIVKNSKIMELGLNSGKEKNVNDDNSEGEGLSKVEKELLQMKIILETCSEIGTQSQVVSKRNLLQERKNNELTKERLERVGFLCPEDQLEKWDFVTNNTLKRFEERNDDGNDGIEGGGKPDCEGEIKTCERCDKDFLVGVDGLDGGVRSKECNYHWGKRVFEKLPSFNNKVQVWTCCSRPVDSGSALGLTTCSVGPHVFKVTDPIALHLQEAFINHPTSNFIDNGEDSEMRDPTSTSGSSSSSSSSSSLNSLSKQRITNDKGKGKGKAKQTELEIAAIDCELSYTTQGLSLTRVTVLDERGEVVYDTLVKPKAKIIDFNTRFSGVNPKDFESRIDSLPDLEEARRKVMSFVGKDTFLIGHGLENDLRALRLTHTRIVDTTMLFPHAKGLPFRQSLKYLTSKHLGKIIQSTSSLEGHSSAEDAKMALELVRWKYINEPQSPFNATSSIAIKSSNSTSSSSSSFYNTPDSSFSSSFSLDNLKSNHSGQHFGNRSPSAGPSTPNSSSNNKPLNFFGSPNPSPRLNHQEVAKVNIPQGPSKTKPPKVASAFIPSQPRRNMQIPQKPSFSSPKPHPGNPFIMNNGSPRAMRMGESNNDSPNSRASSNGSGNGIIKVEGWTDEMERSMNERKEKERKIKEGLELMPLGRKK